MIARAMPGKAAGGFIRRFRRDPRASTAVEFGMLAGVLITMILGVLQFALVFLCQMMLRNALSDAATGDTQAQAIANNKSAVVSKICGDLVLADNCSSGLLLEMGPISGFGSSAQAITGASFSSGTSGTPVIIRAKAPVFTFVPGLTSLKVQGVAMFMRP